MQFATALSTAPTLEAACREAAKGALAGLSGGRADLAVVFASPGYGDLEPLPHLIIQACEPRCLVGCTGGGIVGGGLEVESRLAVTVLLGSLPNVELHPRVIADPDLPGGDEPPSRWIDLFRIAPSEAAAFLVLPEPFSSAADRLLQGLDFAYAAAPKFGGIVSGSRSPNGHALFHDRALCRTGALVLGLSGNVAIDTAVAQGCKPFGRVGRITNAENHYLITVDGKRAINFLREQLTTLEGADRTIAQSGQVFLGVAMDPFATEEPTHGDFLIRNLVGFDEKSGVVAVGELLSVGRRVQLHLRDGDASHEDLTQILRRSMRQASGEPSHRGALLFSCLGRGEGLYGEPDHDSRVFREIVGDVPLAGFFCNGEIGPVQGATHLHGYTSSFGMFRPRSA